MACPFQGSSPFQRLGRWPSELVFTIQTCPQKPCKKSGSGIPVTPALGRVKNAPLCVCIPRNTHAHTHARICCSRSIRKLTSDAPPPNTVSFFPRLTAHREIILATCPSQNRALYVMEKSSHEPCQISSSKHRLVEIHLMPLSHPAGFYILPHVLTSPFSFSPCIYHCLFLSLVPSLSPLCHQQNRSNTKAQGTGYLVSISQEEPGFYAAP